jgi:hypothetical protein
LIALANLAWEAAHLPLYTLWSTGTTRQKLVAVFHCTAGDALIAMAALLPGLLALGSSRWPRDRHVVVAIAATAAGLAFTAYSEWMNTLVWRYWEYNDYMPRLPGTPLGLSPMLQWAVIPPFGLWWSQRTVRARSTKENES